ncbi:phage tail assembly chaperone [Vibrio rotiferianus]|uniref:phage tail assembly chaperone n=1 Tax=Vibrio rotiferianus TaxID=190895 RepID=UPI003909DE87
MDYVDSKNYGSSFPYFTQVEDYKQALRDYPMQPDFPYGERPVRPVNENGNPIIT